MPSAFFGFARSAPHFTWSLTLTSPPCVTVDVKPDYTDYSPVGSSSRTWKVRVVSETVRSDRLRCQDWSVRTLEGQTSKQTCYVRRLGSKTFRQTWAPAGMGKTGTCLLGKCCKVLFALVVTAKRSVDEIFMHYSHNLSSVSGGFAPDPQDSIPKPRWGLWSPDP